MEVKKIVEGMTAPQVAQVIDDNFKAQNAILEEDIAKQNNVIGVSEYKDFSEAEAVNVGDVRKYNGLLYECVEATTGAFDASKWKKSSFKAETEKKLSELGSQVIYDVSANNDGATFASLSALLSSENLSTLIPIAVRCGGMSIRFAQTSDNKYVQFRLRAQSFSTTITDWEKCPSVTYIIKGIGASSNAFDIAVGECFINVTRNDFLRQKSAEPDSYISVSPNKDDIILFGNNQFRTSDLGQIYNIVGYNKKKANIDDILFSRSSVSGGNIIAAGNNRFLSEPILGQNIKIVLNSGYYGYLYIWDAAGENFIFADETAAKSTFEVAYPALLKFRLSVRKSDNSDILTAKEAIQSIEGFYLNESRNYISLKNFISENTESNKFTALSNSTISDSDINLIEVTVNNNSNGSTGVQYNFPEYAIKEHKYYLGVDVLPDRDGYVLLRNVKTYVKGGQWNKVSMYANLNSFHDLAFRYSTQGVLFGGDKIKFKNFVIIDITDSFSTVQNPSKAFIDNVLSEYDIIPAHTYDIPVDGIIAENSDRKVKIYGSNIVCDGDGIQCTGIADQELINTIISDTSINEVEFANGSIFNLNSAIKVRRDNLTIKGNNAKFFMANVVEVGVSDFRKASNNIDWIIVCNSSDYTNNIEKIVDGVYVEIYNEDATQNDHTSHCSGYIINAGESINGKQLRLGRNTEDTADAQTPATYVFKAGAKMRTVPSVWDIQNVSNVVVDSVYCDLNLENNPRSNDTFIAQNGLHFYNCQNCEIKNSNLVNGGRHGILLSSSKYCKVTNCYLDTWQEHCIDVASHTNETFDMFNIVSGCTLKNPSLSGIQMHKGSRNIITDNFIVGGYYGISSQESAYYNNICNNTIIDSVHGICLMAGAKGIVVSGNIIKIENDNQVNQLSGVSLRSSLDCIVCNNNVYGYRVGIEFETCTQCKISGNMTQKSKTNGIRVTVNSQRCTVENNTSIDECQENWPDRHYFIQVNNSKNNIINGNSIFNTVSGIASYTGIGETGDQANIGRNIFINNVINGLLVAVSILATSSIDENNYSIGLT